MIPSGGFTIPVEHPSRPGHFPGHPVVPGVLLLAEIFALLGAAHPGCDVGALEQARFLLPVQFGEPVTVAGRLEADRAHFIATIGAGTAVRGVARMRPA